MENGMVTHVSNHSTQDIEEGEPQVQGHPGIHKKRPFSKNNKQTKKYTTQNREVFQDGD
jgi:hypothetical protein